MLGVVGAVPGLRDRGVGGGPLRYAGGCGYVADDGPVVFWDVVFVD